MLPTHDIHTMCHGGDCPMKERCLRYSKRLHDEEIYFMVPPWERGKQGGDPFCPDLLTELPEAPEA